MAAEASYRLRPLAERDLREIWLYTADRWSSQQADAYVRTIIEAFAGLAAGTKIPRKSDVRPAYLKYVVGSHVIYFKRAEDGLDIVRVLHGRMDVDRHMG